MKATTKSIRMSPRKVRLVADAIRRLPINEALRILQTTQKYAALPVAKTLKSAIANATNNAKLDRNNLLIASIQVTEGQSLKRFHPSTRGRVHPYKKRTSHLTIVLQEKTAFAKVSAAKGGEK